METVIIIGRIVFGALIVFAGLSHFMHFKNMVAYTQSKHVPLPAVATVLGGVLLVLGGLSFIFAFWVNLGIILLLVFFIPVSFIMHRFWSIKDKEKKMPEMHYFMGNIMLVGLLMIILGMIVY